jgi:hypothetical protein
LRRKAERVAIEKEAAARLASQKAKVERLAELGAAREKAKVEERERLQMENVTSPRRRASGPRRSAN